MELMSVEENDGVEGTRRGERDDAAEERVSEEEEEANKEERSGGWGWRDRHGGGGGGGGGWSGRCEFVARGRRLVASGSFLSEDEFGEYGNVGVTQILCKRTDIN
ncbi:hypothetical protein Salat_2710200 [Sesamum alatum]|uniref:Uncharacterized protein n=1 Tax=Sesamum alatum TaxID=300844 RepID=A0AAE2CBF6_9LAMI|nr:hypothetical protein Salat_2710200 [Sesamum alatum]